MADELQVFNEPSLAHRYAVGSNDISWYVPGTTQHSFFIGMPQNVSDLSRLNRKVVQNLRDTHQQLRQAHSENIMVLNEIGNQISQLESSSAQGFSEMAGAICHLEDTLWFELSGIKWVLGQMDSRLADLVKLVRFPRQTESHELVEDGVKALATGNLDDAEACLLEAVEKKRTSFQAHTNLGFVFLNKNDADSALTHFQKAVDYVPDADGTEIKIFALENLARAHFAAKNFDSARSIMKQADDLRNSTNLSNLSSKYHLATYCALSGAVDEGTAMVVQLCKLKPTYFAVAAADKDFLPVRDQLMNALDELARSENRKGNDNLALATKDYERLMSEMGQDDRVHVKNEIDSLQTALDSSRRWLGPDNYSDSVRAVIASTAVSEISARLSELSSIRSKLKEHEEREHAAEQDYTYAEEECRRETDKDRERKESLKLREEVTEGFADIVPGWGCGVAMLVLVIAFFRGCASSENIWGGGFKLALLCFVASVFISLIIRISYLVLNMMRRRKSRRVEEASKIANEKRAIFQEAQKQAELYRRSLARVQNSVSKPLEDIRHCVSSEV